MTEGTDPRWWNDQHESAWQKIRHGLAGTWMLPAGPEVATPEAWQEQERATRFGFGARRHYAGFTEWTPEVESFLQHDWEALDTGRTWDEIRSLVRHGWAVAGDDTETPDRVTH